MTRRTACLSLLAWPALKLRAQTAPDSFRTYSDSPRLFLRPARLKLLRRERERQSLRWEQFDLLWKGQAVFPEAGWVAALRYQIAQDEAAGRKAVAWAAGAATDIRQIALVADWCAPLISGAEQTRVFAKLQRALTGPPARTLAEARNRVFAAVALSEAQPDASERALKEFYESFWLRQFIAPLREAKVHVSNADALTLLEILHAVRDNINFDLRDNFPAWFKSYPLLHVMAHYPAPWPAAENEFRIPADRDIQKAGPDVNKAALSRAAELAMVAFDANSPETQLLQGFLMNDRFLMRGPFGIPYEILWANPYQPGLSYYHVPLAQHDPVGGQLFVRSSWEDDASWAGFFDGQLQLWSNGSVTRLDPQLAHEPMDLEEATVFFGRNAKKFRIPSRKDEEAVDDVFIVGLEPKRGYHVEVDAEGMMLEHADAGGIIYLPGLPPGAGVVLTARS